MLWEKLVSSIGGRVPLCGGMFGPGGGDCNSVELLEAPRGSNSGGTCQKTLAVLEKSLGNRSLNGQIELHSQV